MSIRLVDRELAAKGPPPNGHALLEEAIAVLIQNQAAFVGRLGENERRHLEYEREANERVAKIEAKMSEVIRILSEHNRQVELLTEAVRDTIGFKG
jgi:hypothetical protein